MQVGDGERGEEATSLARGETGISQLTSSFLLTREQPKPSIRANSWHYALEG